MKKNPPDRQKIRLNRYLALCGLGSRRKCDELIASGGIRVNDQVVTEMGVRIDPHHDLVEYYNQKVVPSDIHIYILLHKPARTVTTASDERHRKTVLDVLDIDQRVFPVGRLDYNTTGALLLTSDGKLAFILAHPRFKVTKIYRVLLDRRIRPVDLHNLRKGIMLDDRKTAPCKVEEIRILDNASLLEVELHEGRNRQIRRMMDLLDYRVVKLFRVEFAGLRVDDLKPGEWRTLTAAEVQNLRKLVRQQQGDIQGEDHEIHP